jgi:hypothetical protein
LNYASTTLLIASAITELSKAGYTVEQFGSDLWRLTNTYTHTVTICLTYHVIDLAAATTQRNSQSTVSASPSLSGA